jgi:biopolymer transport protein ExbD
MLGKRPTPTKPISAADLNVFTHSFTLVAIVLLLALMSLPTPHQGVSVDIPKVNHPKPMPRSDRDDALVIAIFRTGDVFFGMDKLPSDALGGAIQKRLPFNREQKVYIKADARVKWRSVDLVLDQVRAAGIESVGFIVEQSKESAAREK